MRRRENDHGQGRLEAYRISLMDFPNIPYLGELAALSASLIWSCSITLYRAYGRGIPAQTLNLFKMTVALVGYGIILVVLRPSFPGSPEKIGWLMLSGVIGFTIGDTLFFVSIGRLGAQLSSALQCLTPILNALFDWMIFDTFLTLPQLVGLGITIGSVVGVVLSGSPVSGLEPRSRGWWVGLIFGLTSAFFNAVAYSMAWAFIQGEDVFACVLLRIAPAMLLLLVPAIFSPVGRNGLKLVLSQPKRAMFLILAGFLGTVVGLSLLTLSLQKTSAGIASTISTTYPIWVIPVAAIFLKEHPKPLQILCTILAVAGIALLVMPGELYSIWQCLAGKLWFG